MALLRQYGAEVVLTPGILIAEAVGRARGIAECTPDAVNRDQFQIPQILLYTSGRPGPKSGMTRRVQSLWVITMRSFARRRAREEGILGGVAAGAALQAALHIGARPDSPEK